jgi:SAM-dependent methyltransferase
MSQALENSYTSDFYVTHKDGSRRSAEVFAPLVIGLVNPSSVVDVGCGVGTWLSVFKTLGVTEILGLDGDYVDQSQLEIDKSVFLAADLTRPFQVDRQFDLVVSLEVAEHLPKQCASRFVESLIRLGPIVLFSAAIPHQGGTRHINEQWPEYWVNHFSDHGYEAIDCIRRRVWNDDRVEWWYAQNTFLFVEGEYLRRHPQLENELGASQSPTPLAFVHPTKYLDVVRIQVASRELASLIPLSVRFILVDQDQLRWDLAFNRHIIPFPEHGAHFSCSLDNERLVAFDMRQKARSSLANSQRSRSDH